LQSLDDALFIARTIREDLLKFHPMEVTKKCVHIRAHRRVPSASITIRRTTPRDPGSSSWGGSSRVGPSSDHLLVPWAWRRSVGVASHCGGGEVIGDRSHSPREEEARDKAALEEHFWPETELLTSRSLEEMQQQAEDDEA
jgi:hypothetical protein